MFWGAYINAYTFLLRISEAVQSTCGFGFLQAYQSEPLGAEEGRVGQVPVAF